MGQTLKGGLRKQKAAERKEIIMKKSVLYLCAGILVMGLTACGGKGEDGSASGNSSVESTGTQGTEQTGGAASAENPEGSGGDAAQPGEEGWSEEMAGLRAAVVEAVGQDEYWPNMPMDGEMLNMRCGITADMYDDYMAESPMISANVDTLIIVRAKAGQADTVYDKLNAYRDALVSDTMQYPSNLGKIQSSQVEKIGDYVVFVQLGGEAGLADDEEEAITNSQEANSKALEAIKGKLR